MRKLLVALGALILVLGFQNCSKVQPNVLMDDVSGKSGSDSDVDGDDGADSGEGSEAGDENPEKHYADCSNAKSRAVSASGDIRNLRGTYYFKADDLGVVDDVRGKLILVSKTRTLTINSITNIRGRLVICDADVGFVGNTRGTIVAVETKIGALDDHRGVVHSVNSVIENISNIRGSIKEYNP